MKRYRNWIVVLVLSVTAGAIALQNRITPIPADMTEISPDTGNPIVIITDTIVVTPAYEGCAYTWAYHDAPDLKEKIESDIHALDAAARVNVTLFGEDCVYADGHSTFGVMETDFYVYLTVDDLTAEENFGNWMGQVLSLITKIPREDIQGNYGFVEFWFEKNDLEHVIVRVPIQQYNNEAQGKTGAELFRMFYKAP